MKFLESMARFEELGLHRKVGCNFNFKPKRRNSFLDNQFFNLSYKNNLMEDETLVH